MLSSTVFKYFILLVVIIVLEYYSCIAFHNFFKSRKFIAGYLFFSALIFMWFFSLILRTSGEIPYNVRTNNIAWISILAVCYYVPKIFLSLLMLLEDILRGIISLKGSSVGDRTKLISTISLAGAHFLLFSSIYGVIWGRFRFNVMKKDIYFEDLPKEFDGLKVIHISDIHSGSFSLDDKEKILPAIELILEQKPDIVFFTGDLVNNKASEMDEWIDVFSQIKAPLGVYSIFGNHDYGDYISWESRQEKKENSKKLIQIHKNLGWDLLRNENRKISKNNKSIYIVGVENWGKPPFPMLGDLEKATEGLRDEDFKILLSHDPSHFDAKVKEFNKKIHLTLSGHTHGMQFGIEIPGYIKWSPVKYKYPKWAGLYKENGRFLYVNRGFGYLAFPGRVGIWPEVTLLTLKKQEAKS